ncbi:unnamed protein product [Coccothraustes coccothraustes]
MLPPRPPSGTEGGVGRGREVPPPRERARLNGRPPRAGQGRGRDRGGAGPKRRGRGPNASGQNFISDRGGADRGELGRHPIGELSARAGGRSEAVPDQ